MAKGSIWRKWDLHIHCPETALSHQFIGDCLESQYETYLEKLEQSDLAVIGITNYFCIDGYEKLINYKEQGRIKNIKLILPNIEFRVSQPNKQDECINIHIIFSNKVYAEKIREFLSRLSLFNTSENSKSLYCTPNDLKLVGYDSALVELKKLQSTLEEHFIKLQDYIVFGVPRGYGSFRPMSNEGRGPAIAKEIDKFSDAFFGNEDDVSYFLDMNRYDGAIPKPVVKCSDAHDLNKIGSIFSWIKSDTTFEGLKQIIHEPEPIERVWIQPKEPEKWKGNYTLNSVKISNSYISEELEIKEQSISLNGNLVAITGGKGNGKTALLDLIANCFEDRCKKPDNIDDNSFIQRIEDQKKDLYVEIEFAGKEIENFSKKLTEKKFFENSRIVYLPQSKIKEYSGDWQKLNAKIEEIVFANRDKAKEIYNKYKLEIIEIVKQIDSINKEIFDLENETKEDILSSIQKQINTESGQRKNKQDELNNFIESIGENLKSSVEQMKTEEAKLIAKKSKLTQINNKLIESKDNLKKFSINHNKILDDLSLDLLEYSKLEIPKLNIKDHFKIICRATRTIKLEIKETEKQIIEKQEQISQLSESEKTHADMLDNIEVIKSKIESLKKQLNELNDKKDKVKLLENNRINSYIELLAKHRGWKHHYDWVIGEFSKDKSEIMRDIEFKSDIDFNIEEFVKLGSAIFDQRRINISEIEAVGRDLKGIIEEAMSKESDYIIVKITDFYNNLKKRMELLKEKRDNYNFYGWIFGKYLFLNSRILFNGISMDKLSMGQKGTVLLKLFLAEGDCLLIMDQPEENLDNKFIYDELVSAFREAKKIRQIIIATNNANLIVNTDAEQVIVAEFENNTIIYKSGSLENSRIRKDIVRILEGGKEAFEKREKKYGIR